MDEMTPTCPSSTGVEARVAHRYTPRFPGRDQSQVLHDYLLKKYSNRSIDVRFQV